MPDIRPVWLTREQRDWLNGKDLVEGILNGIPVQIVAAWDAAPADAAATVLYAIAHNIDGDTPIESARDAVLRALGMPDA